MPLPYKQKVEMERDVFNSFDDVEVTAEHDNVARFNLNLTGDDDKPDYKQIMVKLIHPDQWHPDETRIQADNHVTIIVSYPDEDRNILSGVGQYIAGYMKKEAELVLAPEDETSAGYDPIVGATTVEITVPVTTDTLYKIDLMINVLYSGGNRSSSRACFTLKDEDGNTVGTRVIRDHMFGNLDDAPDDTEQLVPLYFDIQYIDISGGARTWTLLCEEFRPDGTGYGDNPIGYGIHKNAAGDYIFKTYKYADHEYVDIIGSLKASNMRFEIYAKDTQIRSSIKTNKQDSFVSAEFVLTEIASHMMKYMFMNWPGKFSGRFFSKSSKSKILNIEKYTEFLKRLTFEVIIEYWLYDEKVTPLLKTVSTVKTIFYE